MGQIIAEGQRSSERYFIYASIMMLLIWHVATAEEIEMGLGVFVTLADHMAYLCVARRTERDAAFSQNGLSKRVHETLQRVRVHCQRLLNSYFHTEHRKQAMPRQES